MSEVSCTFFHQSSAATDGLASKEKLLEVPLYNLIIGVAMHWTSILHMIESYLEQQAAVTVALLSKEMEILNSTYCTLVMLRT